MFIVWLQYMIVCVSLNMKHGSTYLTYIYGFWAGPVRVEHWRIRITRVFSLVTSRYLAHPSLTYYEIFTQSHNVWDVWADYVLRVNGIFNVLLGFPSCRRDWVRMRLKNPIPYKTVLGDIKDSILRKKHSIYTPIPVAKLQNKIQA